MKRPYTVIVKTKGEDKWIFRQVFAEDHQHANSQVLRFMDEKYPGVSAIELACSDSREVKIVNDFQRLTENMTITLPTLPN